MSSQSSSESTAGCPVTREDVEQASRFDPYACPLCGHPAKDHWTEAFMRLNALLLDVDAAIEHLSPEERAEYHRCQQSVVDARDYAQRHAHEHWIG